MIRLVHMNNRLISADRFYGLNLCIYSYTNTLRRVLWELQRPIHHLDSRGTTTYITYAAKSSIERVFWATRSRHFSQALMVRILFLMTLVSLAAYVAGTGATPQNSLLLHLVRVLIRIALNWFSRMWCAGDRQMYNLWFRFWQCSSDLTMFLKLAKTPVKKSQESETVFILCVNLWIGSYFVIPTTKP